MKIPKLKHKQIKELKHSGLSDNEIEQHEINITILAILDHNCKRLSEHTGYEIIADNNKIYIKGKSRYLETLVSYKDVICDYNSALKQLEFEINRLYFNL